MKQVSSAILLFVGGLLLSVPSQAMAAEGSLLTEPLSVNLAEVLIALMLGALALFVQRKRAALLTFRKAYPILSNMPTAVAIVDRYNGQLLYGNKACRELLGVRRIASSYYYPESIEPQLFCDILRRHNYDKGFYSWTESLRLPGRVTMNLKISGQPIRYSHQQAWLLYIEESHDQRQEKSQLEKEQKIFQSVLNSLAELVYYQDNQGEVLGTNKAFDHFWRGRVQEGLIDCGDSLQPGLRSTRTWITAPDGSSRLLETSQTSLIDSQGKTFGTLSISHDVTDWHAMQESLKQEIEKREITEQALAQRNSLLDTILSASKDPIGLFNEHWIYVGCNEAFAHSLGHTRETLLGKKVQEVLPEDKWLLFKDDDLKVMEEGETVKIEDYIILEDGTPLWYEVVKSPYLDPTNNTRGVLIMARDFTERKMAEQQLADAIMELQELSFIDSLTKVANRRSFDEQLRKLWHGHMREQTPLSLILCDIDYFKAFNDNYGHQQGDFALRQVAKVLRSVIQRETDEVARYGGEEFAFLLPNTDLQGAGIVADKVHHLLAQAGFTHEYSAVDNKLTVSLGVATLIPQHNQDYGELVGLADQALYQAKADGRNCTRIMSV